MPDELILEKYVNEPIYLTLDCRGMLQCGNVVIADEVRYFDAVTDIKGNIHGIYSAGNGQIVYFRMRDGVPLNKIIASAAGEGTEMSITEDGGILHILIVTGRNIHHFFTNGGQWVKSGVLTLKKGAVYVSSCPCSKGRFALIISQSGSNRLYVNDNGRWSCKSLQELPDDKENITMSFYDGNVEIYYVSADGVETKSVDIDDMNTELIRKEENNMANGNVINSKFIEQMNDNSKKTEDIQAQLCKLSDVVEAMEAKLKVLNVYKESMKQYETQINQLNIKIQELTNRFNGIVRTSKS